jgi:hypothetical protein
MATKRLHRKNAVYTPKSGTTTMINYSEEKEILEVEYKENGRVYHYLEVEQEMWEKYKAAIFAGESSGSFVNKQIKPNYEGHEVDI